MKNNNNLMISTRSMKRLAITGMLLAGGAISSLAAVVTKTVTYDDLQMQAPVLKVATPSQVISGTGSVTYKFKFQIDNGCCMRVKAEMIRRPHVGRGLTGIPILGAEAVVTSKTFEVCGSLADGTTLTTTLNASQDDATFFARFTNLDSWNKAHLIIDDISVKFPTPVLTLSTNPNTPLTLAQGNDEDRPFNVPEKQGTLRVELTWQGSARVRVEIFKPGASSAVHTSNSPNGQSSLTTPEIPVGPADGGEWRIVYTNISQQNVSANSIVTAIKMTVNE